MAYDVVRYRCAAPKDLARVERSSEKVALRLERLAAELDSIAASKMQQEQVRIEQEIESKHLIHFL